VLLVHFASLAAVLENETLPASAVSYDPGSMERYDVAGKVALVTGAARGIGFETARLLHGRGALVTLADLDADEVARAAARLGADRTLALPLDVTDPDAVEEAVAATVDRFGGLDIPVANAGIPPQTTTMRVADPDAFAHVLDVNVNGVWHTVRSSLPQVVARQGHVVVIASVYAFVNGVLATPYAMSKAAVEQLGRALRVELVPHGASATVAYFGFVDTRMVREGLANPVGQHMLELMPSFMKRRITPADAGAAIVRGIERRAPRVIAPRWWTVYSTLRGIINPVFDRRIERDEDAQSVVREGDREPSSASIS
jgi:NAD(P)-dependent dehydrogenase (short-subunit alcohol dehydrogenase family)